MQKAWRRRLPSLQPMKGLYEKDELAFTGALAGAIALWQRAQ
jgi:hypothetical protein